MIATLTSKAQITLPKGIRELLIDFVARGEIITQVLEKRLEYLDGPVRNLVSVGENGYYPNSLNHGD